ncbi:hypothetical protein Pst134EB_024853 [Puccinia striiformis f. sp. tritici]|nr:hypothetical protein Pst134EB_024853 [Puccinia striiformis f. sp. tritici]
MIFISHLHADYHCGLPSLLAERSKLDNCVPLALISQYGIYLYLSKKLVLDPLGLSMGRVQWFNSKHLLKNSDKRSHTITSSKLDIETVPVNHWGKCFGVCIEQKTQSWKIVFWADTKPCKTPIDVGQNVDLLIHKASLKPEETELAETKGHRTIDQAIQVALKMKAENCVLNHFLGRYPKIPPSINTTNNQEMNIVILFDFMSCKIGVICDLQKCIPALKKMVEGLDLKDTPETTEQGLSNPSLSSGKKCKTKNKGGESKGNKDSRLRKSSKQEVQSLANQVIAEPINIDSIKLE